MTYVSSPPQGFTRHYHRFIPHIRPVPMLCRSLLTCLTHPQISTISMSLSNMSNDERDHAVEIMNIKLGYEERLKNQRAAHKEEIESLGRTVDALWEMVRKRTREVRALTTLAKKATNTTKKSVFNSMRLWDKYLKLKKDHSKKRSEIEMLTETMKKRPRLSMTSGTDDDDSPPPPPPMLLPQKTWCRHCSAILSTSGSIRGLMECPVCEAKSSPENDDMIETNVPPSVRIANRG